MVKDNVVEDTSPTKEELCDIKCKGLCYNMILSQCSDYISTLIFRLPKSMGVFSENLRCPILNQDLSQCGLEKDGSKKIGLISPKKIYRLPRNT